VKRSGYRFDTTFILSCTVSSLILFNGRSRLLGAIPGFCLGIDDRGCPTAASQLTSSPVSTAKGKALEGLFSQNSKLLWIRGQHCLLWYATILQIHLSMMYSTMHTIWNRLLLSTKGMSSSTRLTYPGSHICLSSTPMVSLNQAAIVLDFNVVLGHHCPFVSSPPPLLRRVCRRRNPITVPGYPKS
jgi:hypothetical protein